MRVSAAISKITCVTVLKTMTHSRINTSLDDFAKVRAKGHLQKIKRRKKPRKKFQRKEPSLTAVYIQLGLKPMIERMTELSIWLTRFKIAQKVV